MLCAFCPYAGRKISRYTSLFFIAPSETLSPEKVGLRLHCIYLYARSTTTRPLCQPCNTVYTSHVVNAVQNYMHDASVRAVTLGEFVWRNCYDAERGILCKPWCLHHSASFIIERPGAPFKITRLNMLIPAHVHVVNAGKQRCDKVCRTAFALLYHTEHGKVLKSKSTTAQHSS